MMQADSRRGRWVRAGGVWGASARSGSSNLQNRRQNRVYCTPEPAEAGYHAVNVNDRGSVMAPRTNFTTEEAQPVGAKIGIDWASAPFDVEHRRGMEVELEHGLHEPLRNVTDHEEALRRCREISTALVVFWGGLERIEAVFRARERETARARLDVFEPWAKNSTAACTCSGPALPGIAVGRA